MVQSVVLAVVMCVVGHLVETDPLLDFLFWWVVLSCVGDREARNDCILDMVC